MLNGDMQFSLTRSCFYAVFGRCYKKNVWINATATNCKIRKIGPSTILFIITATKVQKGILYFSSTKSFL